MHNQNEAFLHLNDALPADIARRLSLIHIFYTSLSAGAEEIAVLVLTDEDAAAAALDGLEARVADQKAVLESYQPDEVSKLDSAIAVSYTHLDVYKRQLCNNVNLIHHAHILI